MKRKQSTYTTFEKGLHIDALPSMQPDGTYPDAWNAVQESDEEKGGFLSNEASNELWINLPKGEIRGRYYVEERDSHVFLILKDGGGEEIGVADEKNRTYTTICEGDLGGLTNCEWVPMTGKILQPCNQLHVYWTVKHEYYFLNIDDPCIDCDDFRLFKCIALPAMETFAINGGGGSGLPNGKYWFSVRLIDRDGNTSNWFPISKGVNIGEENDGDNRPGERSGKAINIRLDRLNKRYHDVEIAVISRVDGVLYASIVNRSPFGEDVFDYTFYGYDDRDTPIEISEIIARNDQYVRGDNLEQYDGHLLLYELQSQYNLDYQRQANQIQTEWVAYQVPAEDAHKYAGLRRNENYWFGIRWNYCDGTSSTVFHIPGRAGDNTCQDILNCTIENDASACGLEFEEPEYTGTPVEYDINRPASAEIDIFGDPQILTDEQTEQLEQSAEDYATELGDVAGNSTQNIEQATCSCETFFEVLKDANEVLQEVRNDANCGDCLDEGGKLYTELMGYLGLNQRDIYDMACFCDSLKCPCDDGTEECDPPYVFNGELSIDPNNPTAVEGPFKFAVENLVRDGFSTGLTLNNNC